MLDRQLLLSVVCFLAYQLVLFGAVAGELLRIEVRSYDLGFLLCVVMAFLFGCDFDEMRVKTVGPNRDVDLLKFLRIQPLGKQLIKVRFLRLFFEGHLNFIVLFFAVDHCKLHNIITLKMELGQIVYRLSVFRIANVTAILGITRVHTYSNLKVGQGPLVLRRDL